MRIGHGYDVHRLVPGRELILGGIRIPFEWGLLGHSDADVLTHAVMDALLGAAGLADIGAQFPDSEEKYKDADSIGLLTQVGQKLKDSGFTVINIDATVIAQQPKLKDYIPKMRAKMSAALDLPAEGINVKATTEEGLGFTGALEAIAAHSRLSA